MKNNLLYDLLKTRQILISDGATGTNLIQRGLPRGKTAEDWVLEKPDEILKLNHDFIKAGSDIILTSTFGASKIRLEQSGLADRFEAINSQAAALAKEAVRNSGVLVAGSLGPLGHILKPLGHLEEDEAEQYYEDQSRVLSDSGVDLLLVETQFDLCEASAAVKGALSASDLPVICSFSFDRGTRTMMGVSPKQFADEMNTSGISVIGINCGKSLDDNHLALKELADATELPTWFKPNAGLPKLDENGQPFYDISPEKMADYVGGWIDAGAMIVGGCCGTSPDHLKAIAGEVDRYRSA